MTRTRLIRPTLFAAALALAFPAAAFAASAARVDFAIGNVVAQRPDGSQHAVTRGSALESGDTVLTNDGRAQMRFSDGAMVSLRPGSEFRIDDYHYSGRQDGAEKGFFSLLKGGLRTITGWIGKNDRSKYQVKTVVATIGVRGTEYSVSYGNSINVNTGEGVVEVCNAGGCLLLYPGDEGYVPDQTTEPILVQTGEEKPKKDDTPPDVSNVEAPANDRDASGQTAALESVPAERLLFALAESGNSSVRAGIAGGTATFGASTTGLTAFTSTSGNFSTNGITSELGNTGDGTMSWGSWDSISSGSESISVPGLSTVADSRMYYVVGKPTALASLGDVSALPTAFFSTVSGNFTSDVGVTGSVSASMDVTFSSLTVNNLSVSFNAGALNTNYEITASNLPISATSGLTFAGSGTVASGPSVPITCASCSAASLSGAFFGAGATHAGVSFSFSDSSQPASFTGVAAMQDSGGGL